MFHLKSTSRLALEKTFLIKSGQSVLKENWDHVPSPAVFTSAVMKAQHGILETLSEATGHTILTTLTLASLFRAWEYRLSLLKMFHNLSKKSSYDLDNWVVKHTQKVATIGTYFGKTFSPTCKRHILTQHVVMSL